MTNRNALIFVIILLVGLMGLGLITLLRAPTSPTTPSPTPPTPAPITPEAPIPTPQDTQPAEQTVSIYFSPLGITDCTQVSAATRTVSATPQIGRAALEALLQGPTVTERDQGLLTNIPAGTALNSLTIENGVAQADFNQTLNQISGSCRVQAVRAQIEQTLLQFPTVNQVEISINGETETILQP
jgi:spore germination protein GerM